jgi:hypothetical protein
VVGNLVRRCACGPRSPVRRSVEGACGAGRDHTARGAGRPLCPQAQHHPRCGRLVGASQVLRGGESYRAPVMVAESQAVRGFVQCPLSRASPREDRVLARLAAVLPAALLPNTAFSRPLPRAHFHTVTHRRVPGQQPRRHQRRPKCMALGGIKVTCFLAASATIRVAQRCATRKCRRKTARRMRIGRFQLNES